MPQCSYLLIFCILRYRYLEAVDTTVYIYDVLIKFVKFHKKMLSHC